MNVCDHQRERLKQKLIRTYTIGTLYKNTFHEYVLYQALCMALFKNAFSHLTNHL
jgi:hypothetical protein